MRATLALLALLVPLAALPAAATVLHAPHSSLDGSVLFTFTQADLGSVATVQMAGKTYQRTVAENSFSVLVPSVPDGFQRWWANVTLGNTTWRDTGYVAVDTTLGKVALQLDDLQREVASLQNRSASLAGSDRGLAQNLTKLQQGVRQLHDATLAAGNRTQPQAAVAEPDAVTIDLYSRNVLVLLGVVAACLLLLGLNVAIVLQMRRRSRESMVFLLALAGHEGVTPESPEFQQALAALGAKAKPKKEPKAKKGAA